MSATPIGKVEPTIQRTAATSMDPNLSIHANGKYLFLFVVVDNNSDTISDGGWDTAFKTADATHSVIGLYHKCASSNETISTITWTGSSPAFAYCFTLDGVDATTFIDAAALIATPTGPQMAFPRPTAATAGTLNLMFGTSDTGRNVQFEPGIMSLLPDEPDPGVTGVVLGWVWNPLAAQLPQHYFWQTRAADNGLAIVLPVRSAAAGNGPARSATGSVDIITALNANGSSGSSGGYPSWTTSTPTITSIDGIDTNNAAVGGSFGPGIYAWQLPMQGISSVDGELAQWCAVFDAARDLTGKNIVVHHAVSAGTYQLNLGRLSQHGIMFGLGSSASDYRVWDVAAIDATPDGRVIEAVVIDPSDTTNAIDVGAFDISAVDRAFFFGSDIGITTAGFRWVAQQLAVVNPIPLTGGNISPAPAKVADLKRIVESDSVLTILQLGAKQFLTLQPVEFTCGYFVDSGVTLELAQAADYAARRLRYQGSKLSITLASSYFSLRDSLITSETAWDLVFDTDPGDTLILDGDIFQNADVTVTQTPPLSNVTFRGCGELPAPTVQHTNIVIDSPRGTTGMMISAATQEGLQAAFDFLATYEFSNSGTYGLLIHRTAGTGAVVLNAPAGMTVDKTRYTSVEASSLVINAASSTGSTYGDLSYGEAATGFTVTTPISLILQNVPSGSPYWVYNNTDAALVASGTGDGNDITIPFTAGSGKSVTVRVSASAKTRFSTTFSTGSIDIPVAVILPTNPFRVVTDATALAYVGGAITGNTSVVWSDALTLQQCYDYALSWANEAANLQYEIPMSTADGSTFILSSTYTHTVTGADAEIVEEAKEWSGTFTVASGGFFEDANGAIWEDGSVKRASHFRINVRNITNETKVEASVVSYIETTGGTDQTYSIGLVNGGVVSDANGDVEGYVVWKNGATTYSEHKQQVGEYGFDWSVIPRTITGVAIGPEVVRLIPDAQVTLTKANALAVTGITVDHSTKVADLSDETNSVAYDNLKARQTRVADIESGLPGYMSFYEAGLLLDYDGNFFNAKADWTYQNVGGTGVWKGGTIELGTPGDIDLDLNATTLDYTAAGTYDHRNETMDGTIVLTNSSGGAVTVQIDSVGVTVDNQGPDITVDASKAIELRAPNIIDLARVRFYNKTKESHLSTFVVSGGAGATFNTTFGEGQAVELNDQIDLTVCCQIGGVSYWPIIKSQTCLGNDMQWDDALVLDDELNAVYAQYGWTGADVDKTLNPVTGEVLADFANVQIDVNDPDGLFNVLKGPLWFCYICTTETGIQIYNPLALAREPDLYNIVVDGPILVDNISPNPLRAYGGLWKRRDGESLIAPGSNTIYWVPNDRVYVSHVETGVSGVTPADLDDFAARVPTAEAVRTEIDGNSTKLAAILADTDELQSDNVPGLIAGLNNIAATDIVIGGPIGTTDGAVDAVTVVGTTLTNADMRGTDGAYTGTPDTPPTVNEIVTGVFSHQYEGTETFAQYLRLSRSVLWGIVAKVANVFSFKSRDGGKTRITATTDGQGSRTNITVDDAD